MRVTDRITAERLSVDQAYERFFDGFYNLGRPEEIFQRTAVLSPIKVPPTRRNRSGGARWSGKTRSSIKR